MADAIRGNLSTELNGWWGRLVFHPKRCLMTYELKQSTSCKWELPSFSFGFSCCVLQILSLSNGSKTDNNKQCCLTVLSLSCRHWLCFVLTLSFRLIALFVAVSNPLEFVVQDILVNLSGSITPGRNAKAVEGYRELSFNQEQHHSPIDSTYVAPEQIVVDATTSTRSLLGAGNRSSDIPLSPVSPKKPSCKPTNEGRMSKSISNVFHQAAERLQDELLDRLEAMDVKDHAAMSQEAEATFAALDSLLFDYKDFKRHVDELIRCASQLFEIDRAIPTNDSHQKLIEICSTERERLDEINRVHAEALEALIDSKNHIKVLQEEISSALDRLFQIEADVSCCEVEMRCLEIELEKTSQNKEALEGKYLIASKELKESQKLIKHSEAERNAAKAAFDRARAMLRG